jgi:pilus assembly protein FimV
VQKSLLKRLAIQPGQQTTTAKSLVISKLLGVVAALTLSTHVFAIGMGGINVTSALGQPLKADIELVAVDKAEKTSLVARIASPDVYKGAGLDYPYGNKFKFQIESSADGKPYIRVSSAQSINDPFVSLLVELTWSSGKLLREYTFLLDPPGYVPEQPAQAEVQAVAPVAEAVPAEVAEPAEQAAIPATSETVALPAEKPASVSTGKAPAAPAPGEVETGEIIVKRGDTLNKIAEQNKPSEVSLERMLVALYRANAAQFDGKNMNRIRTGKILRLPDQDELMRVTQTDAVKEIHAQVADWNVYRQKLAGAAATSTQPQEAKQVATGKIAGSVAEKAPVAKESAKEVLKLSQGEVPGDKATTGAGGKSISAQDKKNAAQEEAIAKDKAMKEGRARTALLEKNLQDMKRLAELKTEAAALAQAGASPASSAVTAGGVKSEPLPPQPKPKPKPPAKPVVVKPAAEPSLMDRILGEPLYLAGGAAVLLGLLGGLGFMLSRRKSAPAVAYAYKTSEEDIGATTGQITAPVAPSPDTGDFTSVAATGAEETHPSEDVDPISEADLFLNFGRDAQAEEILKEALQKTPNNHQIHLKLLGIYVNRKDVNSFSAIARQLHDSGNEEAWKQAAAMGRKLEPANPMYGGGAAIEDAGSATIMQTATPNAMTGFAPEVQAPSVPDVDFDLGTPEAEASPQFESPADLSKTMVLSAEDMHAGHAATMDFDVTATHPPVAAPGAGAKEEAPASGAPMMMDFDISMPASGTPSATAETETALPNLEDLIFDLTSTHPSMPSVQPEAAKPAAATGDEDAGMAFTLDFPAGEAAGQAAPDLHPAEFGLAGVSLNLEEEKAGAASGESAAEGRDEQWHEVATKLDLAKAYQEMGDGSGAREILDEVLREGDEGQQAAARAILDQLG